MAYDLEDIAEALATAVSGLTADAVGVQAVPFFPANPTTSGVYVHDGEILYDQAGSRGLDVIEMKITVIVGTKIDKAAQRRLRKLSDPRTGIKGLVEADRTLGGKVNQAWVKKASAALPYAIAGKVLVGREFTVEIRATP